MTDYARGDFVKVVFTNEQTNEREAMWVRIDSVDAANRIIFGQLDNEPMVNHDLYRGMQLAVSYDVVIQHMKPSSFNQ